MKVLIVLQYYAPESVGAASYARELALGLVEKGHDVTVLTGFPNYPKRIIFEGYRRKIYMRETIEGVKVIRTYIYANPSDSNKSRILNWGSFSVSCFFGGVLARIKPDVIYSMPPPLSTGAAAVMISKVKRVPIVSHVKDLYPLIAIELGILKSPRLIRFFEKMEKYVYGNSQAVIGLSEGFRSHFIGKGVPPEKTHVVTDWADSDFIQPGPRDNEFRKSLGVREMFTVLYSGNLSYNSNLEPIVEAAKILENEPVRFVIVGEGVKKDALVARSKELGLENVQFLPFQPIENYASVLQASDITVVTLNTAASLASLPSKVFKQMAAGRPILAITSSGNELDKMVATAACGLSVPPDSPEALAEAIRWAVTHRKEVDQMGIKAREYLKENHDRTKSVDQIEQILVKAASLRGK